MRCGLWNHNYYHKVDQGHSLHDWSIYDQLIKSCKHTNNLQIASSGYNIFTVKIPYKTGKLIDTPLNNITVHSGKNECKYNVV